MKVTLNISVICLLVSIISCTSPEKKAVVKPSASEGSVNPAGRKAWDLERLQDPATGKIPPFIRERELAFAATLPNDNNINLRSTSAANWTFRGPWNVGGRTRAFAIDVSNENVLLAGAVSGGMWRSADGGANWTRVSPVNGYPGVNALAQDTRPGHQNTWYYLSGEAYGTSASGGAAFYLGNGMYKSTDGGVTWNSLASTVSGTPQTFDNVWDATWNVVTDPGNLTQDVVYAAAYDAIFRSVNGGTTWSVVRGNSGTLATYSYFTDVAVTPTSVVYTTLSSLGPQAGIWRSTNGATGTYVNILPPTFPTVYDRLVMGIDPNNENIVYFFGPTPGFGRMSTDFQGDTLWTSLWKYEYISGDGTGAGGNWTDLSHNLPGNINMFNGMNTQGGYDAVVRVKPGNSNVVFLGGTNIFRSTSGFTDSTSTTVMGGYEIGATLPFVGEYPNHHPDQHMFAFLPSNPNVMFSAHDGGISKTLDNTASSVVWSKIDAGYISSQFYTVAVDHSSTNDIIIGGLQDNGTYFTNNTNPTSPWEHSFDGDGSYCAIADGGNTYYMSKQQGRMLKATLNSSGVITAYRRFDPIGATGYGFINPYVVDPNNNNLMYLCAGKYVWRNDDLSAIALTNVYDSVSTNWVQFADSLPLAVETLTAMAISKTPANVLYYGTNRRKIFKVTNANVGLPTRTEITSTTFPAQGYTSCIAVNPNNADEIIVVFSNYSVYSIFQTTDGGTTWNRVAGNLEQNTNGSGNGPSCRWAEILPVADGTVYLVGTSTGLYATDTLINNGTVWVQQGTNNIGSAVIDMIDARTTDGLVVVATHGSGLFSTKITSVNQITSIKDVSSEEFTFSVYPNPVGDQLNIDWDDKLKGKVLSISIINELGQQVKRKDINGISINKITIPSADLPKGVYYVKLISDKSDSVKQVVKM